MFIRAVQQLVAKNTGTVIVGLAGPSGAGKTVFSQKIQALMPGACLAWCWVTTAALESHVLHPLAGCALISLDMYNDATRLVDGNFDGAIAQRLSAWCWPACTCGADS